MIVYLKWEKTFLNLHCCVILVQSTYISAELFQTKFLLHNCGKTKHQILQRKYLPKVNLLPKAVFCGLCCTWSETPSIWKVDMYKLFKERKRICVQILACVIFIALFIHPHKLCLWAGILFQVVRLSLCASVRPSIMFCFFNISFNQTLHTFTYCTGPMLKIKK